MVSQMKLAGTNTQSVISPGARRRGGDGSRKWGDGGGVRRTGGCCDRWHLLEPLRVLEAELGPRALLRQNNVTRKSLGSDTKKLSRLGEGLQHDL